MQCLVAHSLHAHVHQTDAFSLRGKTPKIQVQQTILHNHNDSVDVPEIRKDNLRLECPEGKLLNPSRNLSKSVVVQTAAVVRPNSGSTVPGGGMHLEITSTKSRVW